MDPIQKDKIKQFLTDTFLIDFSDEVTEHSDLFKLGIIDSFGYITIVKYIEREFSIKFSEEEMLSNVLVSFSNIVDFVAQKQQANLHKTLHV